MRQMSPLLSALAASKWLKISACFTQMDQKNHGSSQGEQKGDVVPAVNTLTGRRQDSGVRTAPLAPELEGYLDKLKHKTTALFGSSWNRRYFIVYPNDRVLAYFNNKEDMKGSEKPSGSIDLKQIRAVRKFDDTSFQIEAPGRTFHLRAESKAGLACWLMALEKYLSDRQDYDRWKASYDAARRVMTEEQR